MSGKKAQRTKGNVQPSSSSRSAKFLQNEGQTTGFISFSALSGASQSQEIGDGGSVDGEMRVLLRKMSKKDTTTKLKAMQEFTLMCKEKDGEAVKNILNFWPRMYSKMAHDYDHRVREATQQAHYQLTTKAGRNLAPQLKQLVVNWLMSQFDNHAPAARNATSSFDQVFSEQKRKEVLVFCKKEILAAFEKNILHETMDTLSDPKAIPLEEREAKYNRFVSSMFLVLKFVFENIDFDEFDEENKEKLSVVLSDKKFWKFSKHTSPMIRASFFILLLTLCNKITSTMQAFLQQISAAVLTNLDEDDSVVTKALWDSLLVNLAMYENLWEFVNVRKAVWPKFWKLLSSGCHGNMSIVYPNLLPFLSHISPEVAGEGTGFYAEFFTHITEVLTTMKTSLGETDTVLVISSYMECIRFLLLKNIDNEGLRRFIVNDLIAGKLQEVFHYVDKPCKWYELFLKELQLLLSHLRIEATKDEKTLFRILYSHLWATISETIFVEGNVIAFKIAESDTEKKSETETLKSNYYTSLLNFSLFSFKNLPMTNESISVSDYLNDEHLKLFLQKVVKCFMLEIFEKQNYEDGVHLMKFVSMTFDIDLIRNAYVERVDRDSSNESLEVLSNVDICNGFVTSVITPLLSCGAHYENETVRVIVGLVSALCETDKHKYLDSLFEKRDRFSGHVLLLMFSQVFQYCDDDYVLTWLKSQFVEREITIMCSLQENMSNDDITLVWNILGRYITILKDDTTKLSVYHNKLLVLIKDALLKGQRTAQKINDGVFSTFILLCKSKSLSSELLEVIYLVFQSNILFEESPNSTEAMNKGFALLMGKETVEQLKDMSKKIILFIKGCCSIESICEKLSATVFSLILMAQYHSYVGDGNESYGKIILKEMISCGYSSITNNNLVQFFSVFLKNMALDGFSLLEKCSDENLHHVILECFIASVGESATRRDIVDCIKRCEFVHFSVVDIAIKRCLHGTIEGNSVKDLLETFIKNNQFTETIVDHVLMLSSPQHQNYMDVACDTYSMVVSIVDDISSVRALVEMYMDDLRCNNDITSNMLVFSQFIKVLTSIMERWFELLKNPEMDLVDYLDVVDGILTCLLKWKDNHSEVMLFSSSLGEVSTSILALNIHLIQLLHLCSRTALEAFKPDHWDFLLCSLISWVQSCEESLDCFGGQEQLKFMHAAFFLFDTVASAFDSNPILKNVCGVMPSVYVHLSPVVSVQSLSEDTVTEWKELFLPTAGTSLLRIYVQVLKTNCLSDNYVKVEQALCRCLQYILPVTIQEFASNSQESDNDKRKAIENFCETCYSMLASGNWWNKIGCYQLLCGLSELIEGKLCYISQEEDEDHEGMRSFPILLINTMENSRDETLKVLAAEGVSIKDPLNHLEDEKGKSDLLTYLLSWQLILQLFKLASPGNRALFANYFHNNSDVHDLVTCLFCMMSKSLNLEYEKNIVISKFTFPELCQVAFHLLTTSMECIPALIRNWFNNHVNRGDTGTVNKLVSTFISPVLLNNEFQNLNESSKEFNNMIVKTRPVAREIAAVYTVDEVSMELVVQLGANHPLSPVSVTCGKRIGVSNQLWRQWMLQLNTFLSFQNGSILDGLALWKRNVDKRFEGVEECMVCFSVLHGSNYSLPTIACKTCKKKFHPACLYKWFNTSGKCTCPLCRNIF